METRVSRALRRKSGILEAGEETGIERAEAGGRLGERRLAVGGEALPDLVLVAAEGVEGHRNVRLVALAFEHEFPVIAEAGDEADVVFHPAIRDVAGFDQVDDGEQHQRLVRRDAARGGAGGVEVGEFAEPETGQMNTVPQFLGFFFAPHWLLPRRCSATFGW
jgi:hypothetical protein